jgi:hypothetical protein
MTNDKNEDLQRGKDIFTKDLQEYNSYSLRTDKAGNLFRKEPITKR